jgi:multiple antibiotic resistance protein
MLEQAINSFVTLFVTADPIGIAPIFIALAGDRSAAEQRQVALRAVLIAGGILVAFALLGDAILSFFGVTIPAFEVAGGLLLFVIGFQMVFSQGETRAGPSAPPADLTQLAVFPLAIPMISGPGAISATVLLASREDASIPDRAVLLAIIAGLMALTYAAMLLAGPINRILGATGRVVVTRLLGVILAAMAMDFVARGVAAFVKGME